MNQWRSLNEDGILKAIILGIRRPIVAAGKQESAGDYHVLVVHDAAGKRRRQSAAALIPGATSCPEAVQNDDFRRFCRRPWARLIRKVYLGDPMTCPKCGGRLRIISFIDNPCVIKKILKHLKL